MADCCENSDEPADSIYAGNFCVNIRTPRGLMYRSGDVAGSTEFCAIFRDDVCVQWPWL